MKIKFCFFILVVSSILLTGCGTGTPTQKQQPKSSSTPTGSSQPVDTNDYTLKGAIDYCYTGRFRYTYAFKRTDGQPLTSEDKTYLKENSPRDVAYWLKADNGVYGVACSNFPFKQENFDALQKRFKFEDHSEKVTGDK